MTIQCKVDGSAVLVTMGDSTEKLRPSAAVKLLAELSSALNQALESKARSVTGLIVTPDNASEWDLVVAELDIPKGQP